MTHHDSIVIGLGAVGAATLYQLARRGARVLGIDRHRPPHTLGSSHGQSRISRLAVGEGDAYVPLVRRAHRLWRELEADTGTEIFTNTGGLILGPRDADTALHPRSDFVHRTIAIAQRHGIAHEVLEVADVRRRFPQFHLSGDELAYWEPAAGFVRPEAAVGAQLDRARALGAQLQLDSPVLGIEPIGGGERWRVETAQGRFTADQVVLSVGPWLPEFLGAQLRDAWQGELAVYRQVMHWFDTGAAAPTFEPGRFPVFIWMFSDAPGLSMYGFPSAGSGVSALKVATAQYLHTTTPDTVQRAVAPEESQAMLRSHVVDRLVMPSAHAVDARACLYTVSNDGHFVIDTPPGCAGLTVVSACSGHGFKHSAAVGEALAERALGLAPTLDLEPFRHARFG